MAEYDFDIVHRPGKQHANADVLSRYPVTVSTVSVNEQWLNPAFKNDFKKQQGKDSLTATLTLYGLNYFISTKKSKFVKIILYLVL